MGQGREWEKERRGQLVSRLTRDVIGTHAHATSSLAAHGLTGLGLEHSGCIVFFLSVFALHDGGGRDLGYGDCVD